MRAIGYCTNGLADRDVEAALDAVAGAGFARVEISVSQSHLRELPAGVALADFRERLKTRGFARWSVHAPMRRCVLGPPDEAWRREAVGILKRHIFFTGAIAGDYMVTHCVPNPIFVSEPDTPELRLRLRDATRRSLDELAPAAEKAGVRILLENLPYACGYPYLTMNELRPLVDGYPAAAVGLAIDTGHAWTLKLRPEDEILTAGSRLGGTHLHDSNAANPQDDHWVPTAGGYDWNTVRAAFDRIHYAGAWMFEVMQSPRGESPDELLRATRAVAVRWGL